MRSIEHPGLIKKAPVTAPSNTYLIKAKHCKMFNLIICRIWSSNIKRIVLPGILILHFPFDDEFEEKGGGLRD